MIFGQDALAMEFNGAAFECTRIEKRTGNISARNIFKYL